MDTRKNKIAAYENGDMFTHIFGSPEDDKIFEDARFETDEKVDDSISLLTLAKYVTGGVIFSMIMVVAWIMVFEYVAPCGAC